MFSTSFESANRPLKRNLYLIWGQLFISIVVYGIVLYVIIPGRESMEMPRLLPVIFGIVAGITGIT